MYDLVHFVSLLSFGVAYIKMAPLGAIVKQSIPKIGIIECRQPNGAIFTLDVFLCVISSLRINCLTIAILLYHSFLYFAIKVSWSAYTMQIIIFNTLCNICVKIVVRSV